MRVKRYSALVFLRNRRRPVRRIAYHFDSGKALRIILIGAQQDFGEELVWQVRLEDGKK